MQRQRRIDSTGCGRVSVVFLLQQDKAIDGLHSKVSSLFSLASYNPADECLGVKLLMRAGNFEPDNTQVTSLHAQIIGMYVEKIFRSKTIEKFRKLVELFLGST